MTVFLILGDGDFSYSLDLVHYLCNSISPQSYSSTQQQLQEQRQHVIVSGIDSLDEMQNKYKDCDYLIRQLRIAQRDNLTVDIRHGINAVAANENSPIRNVAHVVIFNHPHLGLEDAARHGRFIHHFLNECSKSWLVHANHASGMHIQATVHLTLANGQWERWNGQKAIEKQGFFIKHRLKFLPPQVQDAKYQNRRHQTGKSFQKRTNGSETFVLVRNQDNEAFLFDWQRGMNLNDILRPSQVVTPQFTCPSCERTFREERSLRSHRQVAHRDDDDDVDADCNNGETKKRKRTNDEEIKCPHCDTLGIVKIFPNEQGLSDHVKAKHSGIHTTKIRPAWAKADIALRDSESAHERCEICDYVYCDQHDIRRHVAEFQPALDVQDELSFSCQFCTKAFKDERAQLQHENFCKARQQSNVSPGWIGTN